jgi:malonyl-CoA O-methyltransferase
MCAAIYQSSEAKSRELVISRSRTSRNAAPELRDLPLCTANCRSVLAEEGYERWAPTYDLSPNPLFCLEERYLIPLLPSMRGKAVLDVACGTGRWLKKLITLGARLSVGVDISAAMLRIAARKVALVGRLARADCAQLPFAAASFDFAICSLALSHIQDLRAVSDELARVLKPDADLFVSDLHPEADALGWRTSFRDGNTAIQIETRPHSIAEILEYFRLSGFDCCDLLTARLGEAEKPIFVQARKEHLFPSACEVPAVLICRFRRNRIALE